MIRYICILVVLVSTLINDATATSTEVPSGGKITLDPAIFPFGKVDPRSKHPGEFTLTNTGDGDIEITKVIPTCGCTLLKWPKGKDKKKTLAPGESLKLPFTYTAKPIPGKKRKTIKVETFDGIKHETLSLIFTSDVTEYLAISKKQIHFSLTTPDKKPTVTITSDEKPFKIKGVYSRGNAIKCEFKKDASAISHTLTFQGDIKILNKFPKGFLSIDTDHPKAGEVQLRYDTTLLYAAKPSKKYFSRLIPGKTANAMTTIVSGDRSNFELGEVTTTNKMIKITATEKLKQGGYKIKYQLNCPPDQKKGRLTEKIIVNIKDDLKTTLTINITGNVR